MENINIAHFVSDEKFIDSAYEQFEEVLPGRNNYFLPGSKKKLDFIKKTPVLFVSRYSYLNPFFIKKIDAYSVVILHSLNVFNQQLVVHARKTTKFLWIGMGYDYYDLIHGATENLLLEITRLKYVDFQINSSKGPLYKKIGRKFLYRDISKKEVIRKIKYFSPVLESEYSLVKRNVGSLMPKYISWNYGISSEIIENNKVGKINKNNILIGNSATFTNNHLEIFEALKNTSISGKKIFAPLSYGDSKYGDMIEARGLEIFGEQFVSIRNFMSFEKYIDTIAQCSNVIMNHLRQQAAGNIFVMLHMGAKVFLNESNPLYMYYLSNGIKIFSINELLNNFKLLDYALSENVVNSNRCIIKTLLGKETAFQKTKNLIRIVSTCSSRS